MVESGEVIHKRRAEFIQKLTPIFNDFYNRVSRSTENVSFDYISQLNDGDFKSKMIANRQRDMIIGHTATGIHRDELEMLLDGYPIKRSGQTQAPKQVSQSPPLYWNPACQKYHQERVSE